LEDGGRATVTIPVTAKAQKIKAKTQKFHFAVLRNDFAFFAAAGVKRAISAGRKAK